MNHKEYRLIEDMMANALIQSELAINTLKRIEHHSVLSKETVARLEAFAEDTHGLINDLIADISGELQNALDESFEEIKDYQSQVSKDYYFQQMGR